MIKFPVKTNNKPTQVDIGVAVRRPSKVRIVAYNPEKPSTKYTDRWQTVEKNAEFQIKLPQNAPEIIIKVFCMGQAHDDNVRLTSKKVKPLKQYASCYSGSKVLSFIRFAQQFSENATFLNTGDYLSLNKKYKIIYMDNIQMKGTVLNTPARINNKTGVIEISKQKFASYTVPMRMAILLHEYSHYYLNKDHRDEIEADLNALKIYMGLGYPVIEGHKSFLHVFTGSPTNSNKERYEAIKTFVDNWEQHKHRFCLT